MWALFKLNGEVTMNSAHIAKTSMWYELFLCIFFSFTLLKKNSNLSSIYDPTYI